MASGGPDSKPDTWYTRLTDSAIDSRAAPETGGEVRALGHPAAGPDLSIRRRLGITDAQSRERQIDRVRDVPAGEFVGFAHVEQQRVGAIDLRPIGHADVAVQHVLGHAGEVDRPFAAPNCGA